MNTIHEYMQELKTLLANSDPATSQDALADAEEYLSNAIVAIREKAGTQSEADALQIAIEQYGTPQEIAAAYVEAEHRLFPLQARPNIKKSRSFLGRFFGVYADSHTWGSLLYILISLATGVIYFTWSVAGVSFSVTFLIFIFGLFFLLFFLYSLRGIALLEGRIVEALLGERMPHRPLFTPHGMNWKQQLGMLLKDKHSWFTLIYTVLQMPLAVLSFSVVLVLIVAALCAFAVPILQFFIPVINDGTRGFFLPLWSLPLIMLGSVLLLTATLHLARGIGNLHGKWAKLLLVVD